MGQSGRCDQRLPAGIADGNTTGIGVLNNDASRLDEGIHAFKRRIGVGDIIVVKGFPL